MSGSRASVATREIKLCEDAGPWKPNQRSSRSDPSRLTTTARSGGVVAKAFGSDVEAELVERIRVSPEYIAECALVADDNGDVVGHVMVSHATIRNDEGQRPIGML